MNNLEKAIETISDLLDEMSDIMDVDASGDPDNAMRWATHLSDVLVRLKRHAKVDTKKHTDLCQDTPPAAVPDERQRYSDSPYEGGYADGWNACRAAILAAQSKEQPQ